MKITVHYEKLSAISNIGIVNTDNHRPVYINDSNFMSPEFQNSWNFRKGLELVEKYGTPKSKRISEKVISMLDTIYDEHAIDENREITIQKLMKDARYSVLISFFCEIGVWKTKEENPRLHDKVFPRYFNNVCWNYYFDDEDKISIDNIYTKQAEENEALMNAMLQKVV